MPVSPLHHIDFLRRIGHNVRESSGTHWFNTSRGVYSSVPYHLNVDSTDIDLAEILGHDGIAARFGCPVDQGVPSFRIICEDPQYDFPALRSRARTQVRRGLEECRVDRVEFSLLLREAMPLNADTLIRQGRRVPEDLYAYWTRYYEQAAVTEGAEAWAAFVGNSLAAYLISFTIDDVANLLIVRSSMQFLDSFPNNALVFQFLHTRLRSGDVRQVCYGYESIQAGLTSLDQFKTGMGFQKIPVGQRVELSRWLKPFVNRFTTPVASQILKSVGRSETGSKLQGLLHWYSEQPPLAKRRQISRAA